MYSLQLSPEQLEIRDTVRDGVKRESSRRRSRPSGDVADRSPLTAQIDAESQLGLRSLVGGARRRWRARATRAS